LTYSLTSDGNRAYSNGLMSRLQLLQKAAAHLITRVQRCKHIAPALQSVALAASSRTSKFRDIHPRLLFVGWRSSCVHYIADECTLVTAAGRRPLRSADNLTCMVKRSRNQFSDRCFVTAGPTLWNSMFEQLRQLGISFRQFKRSLKMFVWLAGQRRTVSEH